MRTLPSCPSLMGRSLCDTIFLGVIILRHCIRSSANCFSILKSLRYSDYTFQCRCGRPLRRLPIIMKSFILLGQAILFIHWWWPDILAQTINTLNLFRNTDNTKLFVKFLYFNTPFSRTPQIQRTIPLSADFKFLTVLLDAGYISQPYSRIFLIHLIQELKIFPRVFDGTPRLVMIGNSCLKLLLAAVMRELVASKQSPSSLITWSRYPNVGTALSVFSPMCSWVLFELSAGRFHLCLYCEEENSKV